MVYLSRRTFRPLFKDMKAFLKASFAITLLALCVLPANAKDQWVTVRSKNFFLVGNASAKDIQKVAVRMEQFRQTLSLLLPKLTFASPRPTNIVVFKDKEAYKPFLPRRSDGKADTFIAGYFQPGEDVNYISLSMEGEDDETFHTIYHEYVHFGLDSSFGRYKIPTWFNEGLAEYYSTFKVEKGNKVNLGYPILEHAHLLESGGILPLSDLFALSNRGLHNNVDKVRQRFYAESWAFIHYLMTTGKSLQLSKFIAALTAEQPPETAFRSVFGMTYADMEKELRKYVSASEFKYVVVTLKTEISTSQELSVVPIDEGKANAYLGDLLYHSNRIKDAEPFLLKALEADPNSIIANTALGMSKVREKDLTAAKKYLDAAVAADSDNYLALYWAARLVLGEVIDENGAGKLDDKRATAIRGLLQRSIAARPSFGGSADLLGYIAILRGDGFDEALAAIKANIEADPGNERGALRIAEILMAQGKYGEAAAAASKIARNSDDEDIRDRASRLAAHARTITTTPMRVKTAERELSAADVERMKLLFRNYSITEMLPKPTTGQMTSIGTINRITCGKGMVVYDVVAGGKQFQLVSKDFQELYIVTFREGTENMAIGCDADLSAQRAYIVYTSVATPGERPTVKSIAFVPNDFELVTELPK